MDEMVIRSKYMKDFISKTMKEVIKKKAGCEVDFWLNELTVVVTDGAPKVHLSLDAGLDKEELTKIWGMLLGGIL